MLRRGSHTPVRSLPGSLISVMLFVSLLLIYIFLKKKSSITNELNGMNAAAAIYVLIKSYGFTNPIAKFVASQACHETAIKGVPFMSPIFKSNNNAFGMKFAGQSTALGVKNGYANYLTIDDSVKDFSVWWVKHRQGSIIANPLFILSLDSYVSFLKNQKYFEAEESEYLKGCQYFYNLLF